MELKNEDVVFCTVEKIEGATVFLSIDGQRLRGTMPLSEVAAGRIRNIREYVSVGRKIVCKVLKIYDDHVELSLRRVTTKEREQIVEASKKERALASVLKIIGEDSEKVISKINEKYGLEFFADFEEDFSVLDEFLSKEKAAKVSSMFLEKSVKEKKVEKRFLLRSDAENGVSVLKEILDFPEVEIHYLGSGSFSISAKGNDFKSAATKVDSSLKEIETRAKKKGAAFEVKGK